MIPNCILYIRCNYPASVVSWSVLLTEDFVFLFKTDWISITILSGYSLFVLLFVQSSRVHITRAVLEQFLSFAKYLDGLPHGAPLLKQLCDHVLFNAAIWIHTPAKVCVFLCISFNNVCNFCPSAPKIKMWSADILFSFQDVLTEFMFKWTNRKAGLTSQWPLPFTVI